MSALDNNEISPSEAKEIRTRREHSNPHAFPLPIRLSVPSAAFTDNADDVPAPLFRTVRYPDLSRATVSPRQRKPGSTKQPSYTSSPINSFARSPANTSRRRANAISLVNSPARRSASAGMAHIWRLSQDTVRFQDEARKRAVREHKDRLGAMVSTSALKENAPPATAKTPSKVPLARRDYLPELVPVGHLSDDIPAGLTLRTHRLNRVPPRVPLQMRESYLKSHWRSASGESTSSVESWLSRIPNPEELEKRPQPNRGTPRSIPLPLSPAAQTHRICASASSIAQRIQLRSPPPQRQRDVSSTSATDVEVEGHPVTLLSRLLKPAVRKFSPLQANANSAMKPQPLRTRNSPQKPNSNSNSPTCDERLSVYLNPSPIPSAPSDSGSSDILYLPKTRQPQLPDPFTPKARPKPKARVKAQGLAKCSNDQEGDGTRKLTPEVKVFRKGRTPKMDRCGKYSDGNVLEFKVRMKEESEGNGGDVGGKGTSRPQEVSSYQEKRVGHKSGLGNDEAEKGKRSGGES